MDSFDEELEKIEYVCARCGRVLTLGDLRRLATGTSPIEYSCPYCGSKVLYKIRRPVAKQIKAI